MSTSVKTREEKIDRHFRNSVHTKLRELMAIMEPGEDLLWGSYNQRKLLEVARDRLDAEIHHLDGSSEDGTTPETLTEAQAKGALALPQPPSS